MQEEEDRGEHTVYYTVLDGPAWTYPPAYWIVLLVKEAHLPCDADAGSKGKAVVHVQSFRRALVRTNQLLQ